MSTIEEHLQMMIREEPLREELKNYVVTGPLGSPMIKHPLVINIFQDMKRCGWVNSVYEHKMKLRHRYLIDPDCALEKYVFLHERPFRVQAFFEYMYTSPWSLSNKLTPEIYWTAVRNMWMDTENAFENYPQWTKILLTDRFDDREQWLMDEDERTKLALMPDPLVVYRGYSFDEAIHGFSWTLDEGKAIWFAKRLARDYETPRVASGVVNKSDVLALFLGRNEDEVLSHAVRVTDSWYVD